MIKKRFCILLAFLMMLGGVQVMGVSLSKASINKMVKFDNVGYEVTTADQVYLTLNLADRFTTDAQIKLEIVDAKWTLDDNGKYVADTLDENLEKTNNYISINNTIMTIDYKIDSGNMIVIPIHAKSIGSNCRISSYDYDLVDEYITPFSCVFAYQKRKSSSSSSSTEPTATPKSTCSPGATTVYTLTVPSTLTADTIITTSTTDDVKDIISDDKIMEYTSKVLLLNKAITGNVCKNTLDKYSVTEYGTSNMYELSIYSNLSSVTVDDLVKSKYISRGLFAQIIYECIGSKAATDIQAATFADIADSKYIAGINYCASIGIFNGVDDTTFNPDGRITLGDMQAVVERINNVLNSTSVET